MNLNSIIIFLVIILIIYIYCYFIFPTSILILQTTINDFNFNILNTRQPIVISDHLKEKEKLIDAWFKYNIINYNYQFNTDNWNHNKFKYLFFNSNDDTEIIIYKASYNSNPPNPDDNIIAIKLQKEQSLIIPFKWKFFINEPEKINVIGIHDLITSFLSLFYL